MRQEGDPFQGLGVMTVLVFAGSSEDEAIPMLVAGLKGLKVIDVACGSGDAQTLAVTENGMWNSGLPAGDGTSEWSGVNLARPPWRRSSKRVCTWVSSAEVLKLQDLQLLFISYFVLTVSILY